MSASGSEQQLFEYQVTLLILVLVVGGVAVAYIAAWRCREGRVRKTASSAMLIVYAFAALFCARFGIAALGDLGIPNGPPALRVVSVSGFALAIAVYLARLAFRTGAPPKP